MLQGIVRCIMTLFVVLLASFSSVREVRWEARWEEYCWGGAGECGLVDMTTTLLENHKVEFVVEILDHTYPYDR